MRGDRRDFETLRYGRIADGNRGDKWFSKGRLPKTYQTPYGEIELERHVYQRSVGGEAFCPLERDARVVVSSTPRFAKMATHKMANGASTAVQTDLAENHGGTLQSGHTRLKPAPTKSNVTDH